MLCESEEKTLHKSDEKYQAYVKILEEELVPAMGCTEPIAIAYAGAVARKTLGNLPEQLDIKVEFVAVAKEFCDFVETAPQMQRRDFIQRLQKFIPLIYLKGSLLPESDSGDSGLIEDIVTEDDYNYLYGQLHQLLGEYDEYLEVFDDNMQFSEVPVVHSIAEKTCDIYQDLKNFISSFRCGIPEVIGEALWQLNNSFELYWGKACAGVLRAVHHAVYQIKDEDD